MRNIARQKAAKRGRRSPDALCFQPLPSLPFVLVFLLLVGPLFRTVHYILLPLHSFAHGKMSPSPSPLFKFNRDGFSVHVSNVADAGQFSRDSCDDVLLPNPCIFSVTRREILDLFNNFIGAISLPNQSTRRFSTLFLIRRHHQV